MKKRHLFLLPVALVMILQMIGASCAVHANGELGIKPAGYLDGNPFYIDYACKFPPQGFTDGKSFKTFSDGKGSETVWIWFPQGVEDLRIYAGSIAYQDVDDDPNEEGFRTEQELYRCSLKGNEILEYTSGFYFQYEPSSVIWMNDKQEGQLAYGLSVEDYSVLIVSRVNLWKGYARPVDYINGNPFYIDYAEAFSEPTLLDAMNGKSFKRYVIEGYETIWFWFPDGVDELRIYSLNMDYNDAADEFEYRLDGGPVYSSALSGDEILSFITSIPEIFPSHAVWINVPGEEPRLYTLGWSGRTGYVVAYRVIEWVD